MARRSVYAYICDACDRPTSEHLKFDTSTAYVCGRCGCEIQINSPQHGVTRAEYNDRYKTDHHTQNRDDTP